MVEEEIGSNKYLEEVFDKLSGEGPAACMEQLKELIETTKDSTFYLDDIPRDRKEMSKKQRRKKKKRNKQAKKSRRKNRK